MSYRCDSARLVKQIVGCLTCGEYVHTENLGAHFRRHEFADLFKRETDHRLAVVKEYFTKE